MPKKRDEGVAELRRVKQWHADDARRALAAWEQSGEPLSTFARRHGLVPNRLAWWRKRLGAEAIIDATKVTLVPMEVVKPVPSGGLGAAVTLLVEDERVRIDILEPARVPPAWLSELMFSLRGRQS